MPVDENGVIINSIESLSDEEVEILKNKEIEINDDIESLIAAKTEYKNSETLTKIDPNFLINPFRESLSLIHI